MLIFSIIAALIFFVIIFGLIVQIANGENVVGACAWLVILVLGLLAFPAFLV